MRRVLVDLDSVALNRSRAGRSSMATADGAYAYLLHDWRGLELQG
jgi:hypothetical protein